MIKPSTATAHALSLEQSAQAGSFTLPADLVTACTRYRRVETARTSLAQPASVFDVIDQVAAEFATGGDLNVDRITAAKHDLALAADTAMALDSAMQIADAAIAGLVRTLGDTIITDHLAPAMTDVIAEARQHVAKFARHGSTRDQLFQAPSTARKAFDATVDLTSRFTAISDARARVLRANCVEPEHDYRNYFAEIRNTEIVWPAILSRRVPADTPWPTGSDLTRLMWFTDPSVQVWCPTVAQQDHRWLEVFEPLVRQRTREMVTS